MTLKTETPDKQLYLDDLYPRGSKFEGQNLTPKELKAHGEELVGKFYTRLGQRPSKTKREQGVQACLTLFDDGFTPAEVDYAIDWLIEHHPETGAFNRVLHFIDQATKERQASLQTAADKERRRAEAEQQAQIEEQQATEHEQVVAFLDTLSESARKELEQQAAQLVQEEHGDVKHGREILVRLKVEEPVRNQYFAP